MYTYKIQKAHWTFWMNLHRGCVHCALLYIRCMVPGDIIRLVDEHSKWLYIFT